MELLTNQQAWIAFLTLFALELVLGIDNIVFISILASKLPAEQQSKARFVGLMLAMGMRVGLLFSISWVMSLTDPLFSIFTHGISGRDLILILGGLFLIGKATHEIHLKLGGAEEEAGTATRTFPSFSSVILQIIFLDLVFSLDSVITAVGMVDQISIMIAAVVASVAFMMFFANSISNFVENRPTIKMLALSFLLMIGMVLVAEGWDQHIQKGYIYFAMGFSLFVEMLNLKLRKKARKPLA
ncbi:MAG: TerC family protein [Verrucomicrobia bacterium]|jgi:predicted tellurium resistance membrane protein TerC|nr:TerC family protein [Verrucomicrobiota bacterium]